MRTLFRTCLSLGALAALALPLSAQTLQEEMARDVRASGGRLVALAEAVPQDTYSWRPGEGVRSVSEVFMHVAAANMGLPASFMGVEPPEGYAQEWFGGAEGISEKEAVVQHLRTSVEHLAAALEGLSDADLQKPVNVFGRDTNWLAAALLLQTHIHEHLGQSIAYARTNGIVPPWSR